MAGSAQAAPQVGSKIGQKIGMTLRNLTQAEKASDFDELLRLFQNYYGPYQYKEALLGIKIDQLAADLKAKAIHAKTDEEFLGYVMQFGAALKDGHVSLSVDNTASGIRRYRIPILLTPLEGRAIVGGIQKDLEDFTEISVGDEVLEVDGKTPFGYLPTIQKYRSLPLVTSSEHFLIYILSRPPYMTDLIPTSKMARIKVKKESGDLVTLDIPWLLDKYNSGAGQLLSNSQPLDLRVPFAEDMNSVVKSDITQMGNLDPIFVTPETQKKFKFVKVYPGDKARKKHGLADTEKPPIYAALYRSSGKTILLARQSGYLPSDFKSSVYMKAYMALFDEYRDLADMLVLDQTHNPGGSYCADFYNIFARSGDVQGVQLLRADRKWINSLLVTWPNMAPIPVSGWDAETVAAWGLMVNQANDAGRFLSDPIPLFNGAFYAQRTPATWDKSMLVLIDELAGSCGDLFPMLVKANRRAKMFGQTTMGLGGNVEEVGILANSRIHVRMTRGLFYAHKPEGPNPGDFVENKGVAPDYFYSHTVEDFRNGYVGYVKAFTEKALEQLQ